MPCSCAAINCTNRHSRDRPDIHLFCFPFSRPEILKKWIVAMRRKDWYPTIYSNICSDHFLPEDFQPQDRSSSIRLWPHAVPSKFNFASVSTSRKKIDKKNYQPRKKRKLNKKVVAKSESENTNSINVKEESGKRDKDSDNSPPINETLSKLNLIPGCGMMPRHCDEMSVVPSPLLQTSYHINERKKSEERAKYSVNSHPINERKGSEERAKDSNNSESLSSNEILKQELEIMTALYSKSQKKLKLCQEQCKHYAKQVIALEEVVDNLKQIISVTDYS